ncbi:MAG TPA: hypothetical protein VMH41_16795 [Mycobacteriales bacterium]|nr:hypothetical protein [Mycobacteriales bacterium]
MATDPITAAMFEVDKNRQIARLREIALSERQRADQAGELANLYGGIVAVMLAATDGNELAVTHEQVAEAVSIHGMLGVRVADEGIFAHWLKPVGLVTDEPIERPRLALVAGGSA